MPIALIVHPEDEVTSFTLVWIKMFRYGSNSRGVIVTSFTLVWIKMMASSSVSAEVKRHELHARVD